MPKKNTIDDLREHLFAALRGMTDKDNPMEIERALAVSDVAQTIINSAKVEVDHLKAVGGSGSAFLGQSDDALALGDKPGVRIVTHRIRG